MSYVIALMRHRTSGMRYVVAALAVAGVFGLMPAIFLGACRGFVDRPAFKSPHRTNEDRMKEIGQQFARLIFAALESPATVDRNDLLKAADDFLRAGRGVDSDGLSLARRVAFRAIGWVVWDSPETYKALQRAADVFRIHCAINEMAP
jgi:hypothetical protein